MQELLAAVRNVCTPSTWSEGERLAQMGATLPANVGAREVTVLLTAAADAAEVVLFPLATDWICDCRSTEAACVHVVAAALLVAEATAAVEEPPPPPPSNEPPVLMYRLETKDGELLLHRMVVRGPQETPLTRTLAQAAKDPTSGPDFPADHDFLVERKLGRFVDGRIPPENMAQVLAALDRVNTLTLDGEAASIGTPTCGLAARVSRARDAYLIRIEQDPSIDSIFSNGALRRGTVLSAVGPHGLPTAQFTALRRGKLYAEGQLQDLIERLIPRLRERLPVVIDVPELPGSQAVHPRIELETKRDEDNLLVLPSIVYGDPPLARLDGDQLTMLGDGGIPLRNLALERVLLKRLEGLNLEPGVRASLPANKAIELTQTLAQDPELSAHGREHEAFVATTELSARLEVDDDESFSLWFEGPANGTGPGKPHRVEADAVVRAWFKGADYAPLAGGGFGRIPAKWLEEHGHRIASLLSARENQRGERSKVRGWAVADLAALCQALDHPPPPSFGRLRVLVENFEGIPEPKLPDDLTATLRDYQVRGIAWLNFLREAQLGALLADDMGLGKTLQALCALDGRSLVVAPTSVLHNWKGEIAKFRPSLKAAVYHGTGRELDPNADVTLTTYAILRLDVEKLAAVHWGTVVLDESQTIKNPRSRAAAAAFRLQARSRIALTGTPVENRLDDLWSQLHFTNPGLMGGRADFNERIVRRVAAGDEHAAVSLRARIRPFVLRRLKEEVASELPPRTDVVLHCELSQEERRVYDTIRAATQESLVGTLAQGASVMVVLEALLRLRQASCHPALLPGQSEYKGKSSAKLTVLIETLTEAVAGGHKALVFSQWTSLLDLVEPQLHTAKLDFVRLDGATRNRGDVVDKFQSDDGPPVMLISLKAGGAGLNLTAADHVFLLDPWWNPAVEDQAADRAHRIGQDKPVLVHRLVARDTVEERILALQVRKRQLADTAMGGTTEASAITRTELMALLE